MARTGRNGAGKITGLGDTRKALRQLPGQMHDGAAVGVRQAAELVRDIARADVPRDTGKTRDGITVEIAQNGSVAEIAETDPDRIHVAEFLEFGTSSIPARPFMTPAAEQARSKFPTLVAGNVTRAVDKR